MAAAELGEAILEVLHVAQQLLGLGQQVGAGLGERHLVGVAAEQAGADGGLELRELLRQRGLGEAELLGGAGQRLGMGDGPEDAQLVERDLGAAGPERRAWAAAVCSRAARSAAAGRVRSSSSSVMAPFLVQDLA